MRAIFLSAAAFILLQGSAVRAQSLLEDASVFGSVVGLNTVPDHGDVAVSYLDYRNAGYSVVAVDVSTGTEREIERVFYAEPVVSTFGNRITWIGYTPIGQPDVYVHDQSTGSTGRLTSDAAFQNHPDLAEDVLIWQDYRNAGSDGVNADIYMHDFATGTTSAVTTDPGYQDLPRIHGSWVVWQDYRHSDSLTTSDIYAYDLGSGEERQLTTGSIYRTHPDVWNSLVVWEDYRNGDNGDIYLYDLATGQERPITTDPAHQGSPAVDGEWVLWLDYRNSTEEGDLYGYHLGTEEEYSLLIHPAHQEAPHIFGGHAVWQDYRNEQFDIFGGTLLDPSALDTEDLFSRVEFELTAVPNPFAGTVTFNIHGSRSSPLELTIYDALGRTVARRHIPTTDTAINWDGRDDGGLTIPAGVYIAVVSGEGVFQPALIVRM